MYTMRKKEPSNQGSIEGLLVVESTCGEQVIITFIGHFKRWLAQCLPGG